MRTLLRLIVLIAIVAAGFAAYAWRSAIAPIAKPQPGSFDAAAVKKGAELAALGNCISCHTKDGGEPYSGGRAIDTPFGRIHATNITPEPETGIGGWSEAAFTRAVREGVSRDGRHLYPAFPYDHMTRTTDADIKSVYAFLMTRRAVRSETPANTLRFPYSMRSLVAGWKLAFFRSGDTRADSTKSAEWNRGAYLVEGLAHCGACHTPRNAFGAESSSNAYGGGETGGWTAPALNAASPAALPWTPDRLTAYLRTGDSAQHGVAAGPMAPVVDNLAQVSDTDLRAIATYVASVAGTPSKERVEQGEKALARSQGAAMTRSAGPSAGAAVYAGACAQCHGESGRAPLVPALNLGLSSAVRGKEPNNLLRVVLDGLTPADNKPGPVMPGFAAVLSDKQLGDLIDYLRASFTDRPAFAGLEAAVRNAR